MTNLQEELAHRIAALIRARDWKRGRKLPERGLAEELKVSRTPIRAGLRFLSETGMIRFSAGEGYSVDDPDLFFLKRWTQPADDALYLAIAADRSKGLLPDRISESEVIRRYGTSRSVASKAFLRIANEGWIERLPGNGWLFLPMLTSEIAYGQSFRFRLINEPAALLESDFEADREALLRCREQQVALVNGEIGAASVAELFELNRHLHETILECCHNHFIIDAVKRVNGLRRLMELGSRVERSASAAFCHEHIQIIDLILEDRLNDAAALLRLHLGAVARKKVNTVLVAN